MCTIQNTDEFACCGGYTYNNGYQDWKHSHMGMQYNSVPDTCCLKYARHCGNDIFRINDDRKVFTQIFTHGCITLMQRRLEDHVVVRVIFEILVFSEIQICLQKIQISTLLF